MNNTINTNYNIIPFRGRYLVIPESYEKRLLFPNKIKEAIHKNEAIRDFISSGNPSVPRTFWEKFKDLFKKDEILEVYYNHSFNVLDDSVHFRFGKNGSKKIKTCDIFVKEENKNNPDFNTAISSRYDNDKRIIIIDMLAKEVEKIQDFGSLLKDSPSLTKPL